MTDFQNKTYFLTAEGLDYCMPLMVNIVSNKDEQAGNIVKLGGFGENTTILTVFTSNIATNYDPYKWRSYNSFIPSDLLIALHLYIKGEYDVIENGDVIEIDYIEDNWHFELYREDK